MRAWFLWGIWPLCIVFSIGSMMYCNAEVPLKQFSQICAGAAVGLFGNILLFYAFLGNGESLLFRQRTVRLYGETLCRVAEGSLGALMVLGSLAYLGIGIMYFGTHKDPTLMDNEVKSILCIAETSLILLFALLIAIMAFAGSSRAPSPAPPPDTAGDHGQDTFNF